ncbi:MAG: superoxide dismutase family protein [Fibrella sp.]|nr:superoxide dismutase family protein [Armatimonadota bacterium]
MKNFRTIRTASRFGVVLLALTMGGVIVGCGGSDDNDNQGMTASAALIDTGGRSVGTARFTQERPTDPVTIRVQVTGLTPGQHGIHLHQVGRAEPNANPPFATAGEHINPSTKEHGLQNPDGSHDGDLPNLNVGVDDRAIFELTTTRVTLYDGANSLFDSDGSALIIHASPDDQRTDPTGGTGARVVCGVVTRD